MRMLRLASTLLLVGSLTAQAPTTSCPRVFLGHFAPGGNLLPHGRTGGLIQYWYRGDNFDVPQVITQVGVRPDNPITAPASTQSMEIVFDNVTAGFATLNRTFAMNFVTPTTVFARRVINLPPQTPPNNPNAPVVWMPLDNPWVFTGPHFLAQFDAGTAVGAANTPFIVDAYTMAAVASSHHTVSAASCGGSLVATYVAPNLNHTLSGALPNNFVVYMIGTNNHRFGGAVPLPLPLDPIGLTGCYLGVDPILWIAGVTDANGGNLLSLPIALPTDSAVLYAQALHAANNPVGLATTNLANSILGGAGLSNYLYNFTADGPVAQYGPYTTNRCPVLLFQP